MFAASFSGQSVQKLTITLKTSVDQTQVLEIVGRKLIFFRSIVTRSIIYSTGQLGMRSMLGPLQRVHFVTCNVGKRHFVTSVLPRFYYSLVHSLFRRVNFLGFILLSCVVLSSGLFQLNI